MRKIGFEIKTLQRGLDRVLAKMIRDNDPFQRAQTLPAGKVKEALP